MSFLGLRAIPTLAGIFVFAVYSWLAFRCFGYDWSISETFGEVLSSANRQGAGFPYFSYLYNGGVYLAHDPQAMVTSPLYNISVFLTGSIAGARWLGVAYGVFGYLFSYFWLRTRFSLVSSVFGALALSLSLGMFWRMVAGHTIFLLEMFLPFFLLAIIRIEDAPTPYKKLKWIIWMALGGAWIIYEPGFHALFYFIFPALLIELFVRFIVKPRACLKLLVPLSCAGVLSALMVLPKILSWTSMKMSRAPDATDGTLALKDVLGALFITARSTVMGFHVPGSNPERWHFIFEVNAALMPVASLAALVGIYLGVRRKWYREKNFCLALGCLVLSILLASNQTFWELVQSLTAGGIRVPSRFIALGSFGLVIFSVYAMETLLHRFQKYGQTLVLASSVILLVLAGNWLFRAQKSGTLLEAPIARSSSSVKDPQFLLGKYCPVGSGCLNSYQVGYDEDPYIQYLRANQITESNFKTYLAEGVEVQPTLLTLASLGPGVVVDLPLRFVAQGHRVSTLPPGLLPRLEEFQGHLRIYGDAVSEIQRLQIRPALPFPSWSAWLSIGFFLLSVLTLAIPVHSRPVKG